MLSKQGRFPNLSYLCYRVSFSEQRSFRRSKKSKPEKFILREICTSLWAAWNANRQDYVNESFEKIKFESVGINSLDSQRATYLFYILLTITKFSSSRSFIFSWLNELISRLSRLIKLLFELYTLSAIVCESLTSFSTLSNKMAPISTVVTLLALFAATMAAPNGVGDELLSPQNEAASSIRLDVNLIKNETENGRGVPGEFAHLNFFYCFCFWKNKP